MSILAYNLTSILAHNLKPYLQVWGFTNGFVVMLHIKYDNIFKFEVNAFKGTIGIKLCDANFVKNPIVYTFLKERKGDFPLLIPIVQRSLAERPQEILRGFTILH